MATYDLDRWSKSIRKRHHGEASLTLHLHPNHCRFEHQNGVFLYDSPIRALLESIKDARLPVELLDLLDATAVKYFDGCLVVEVIDHRGVVDLDAAGAAGENGPLSAEAAGGSHSRSASNAGSLVDGRRGSRSILPARGADGRILKPSLSLSVSDVSDPNAASFQKRFMVSYKRFELALQEAAGIKANQLFRDKRAEEQRKQRQQVSQSAQSDSATPKDSEQNKENEVSNNASIHSAIAAAVATATTMNADGEQMSEEDALARTRPLSYRITLGPDIETVWTDLCAMREEKRARWTEDDMIAIESRILALTAPPLCLSPDMQVSRIANALLDATSLPVTPAIPTRKREAPLQPIKALPKSVKRAKKGSTDKAEKEAAEKAEQEEDERARLEAQQAAEREEEEAWMRVMDDSYASRMAFQPSFSRLAFVQNWREKKAAEEERIARLQAEAAAAQAQAEAEAREAARAARIASKNNSRQGSVSLSQSRQGSVIDIPVNAPTPSANNSFQAGKNEDISMEMQQQQQQQQSVPKKKKTNKNKDKAANGTAGSPPNPNNTANDLGASTSSGPLSLKLTLPGKNKKKDKGASKAGSPDIAVNPSPPPSANTPVNLSMPNNNNNTSTPTAAQQAIMRKTVSLPKAKLKSDLVKQMQAAQQQPSQATGTGPQTNNQQLNSSPVAQQGTPQTQNQILQGTQQPIRPSSTNPQMNLPIQPQRNFVSPVQSNQPNANQFSGQQNGSMDIQPGQPLNIDQTQQYVNQLQAQMAQYQQAQQQQNNQQNVGNRNSMSFANLAGSPYSQNMQMPNQQMQMSQNQFPTQPPQGTNTAPAPQNFANIHRSPVYANASLPQQQVPGMQTPQPQHQFIPFNSSGSPPNVAGMNQQQFTPQQAFQLQQLQQTQQNMYSQHTQALANFGQQNNNMGGNMNFNMAGYGQGQQQQQPFGQQAMQNMSNMPNINIQNMQMNQQFNPALLSQLQRQQQSQGNMGMQGYNSMQNQWQGQ